MMQFTRLLCGLLFATLLAACGGGGGSAGTTTGSSSKTTVTLEVIDSGGSPVTTLGTTQSTFARATVRDGSGHPVAGTVVKFTNDDGLVAFFPTTALTDAGGVAVVQVVPGSLTAIGAGTLKADAEVNGTTAKQGVISVQVVASGSALPTISLQLVGSNGQATNTVSALTPVYAQATVRDTAGVARPGVVIKFSADATIARFTPDSGTALTDSNGVAKVQILPASATSAGAGVLKAAATISGAVQLETSLAFQVPQGSAVDPLTAKVANIVLLLDRSTLKNSGVETAKLTVVAVDSSNNVAPGAKVTVSTDANTIFTPNAFVTDAQGQYIGQIAVGGDKSDRQVTVTATSNGVTRQTTLQIVGSKLTLQAVPPTPAPGQAVAVTVTLLDSASNPIPSSKVTLGGNVSDLAGRIVTTDFKGSATTSFIAPTAAGVYTISASGSGVKAADYQLQVFSNLVPSAAIPAGVAPSLSASPNVLAVNSAGSTTSQSTLRFLFLDGSNRPIPNVRVRFDDTTVGLAAVGASISSGSSTLYTDTSGTVLAQYIAGQNSSPTNGISVRACYSATDFASSTDCPGVVNVTLTTAGQALAVSIGDDNKLEKGGLGGTYIKRFVVTVADAAGRAVPNAPVDISVDLTHFSKGLFFTTTSTSSTPTTTSTTSTTSPITDLTVDDLKGWLANIPRDLLASYPSATADPSTVVPSGRVWCANEDINRNGVVDPGENRDSSLDSNGQPTLDPRKSDLIVSYDDPAVTKTDPSGILIIKVEYSQRFASWLAYKVRLTANVQGSQGMAERLFITQFLVDDAVDGSFRQPPYGTHSCSIFN